MQNRAPQFLLVHSYGFNTNSKKIDCNLHLTFADTAQEILVNLISTWVVQPRYFNTPSFTIM